MARNKVCEVELKPFVVRCDAITAEQGCVLWGTRVVIPASLRAIVIRELHASHFGVVRMKALARAFVWWPNIDGDIENWPGQCQGCLENKKNLPKISLTPWQWPVTPWRRVHADFLGPFRGSMILVIIDSHSKWPEVFIMKRTTASDTIRIFQHLFASFGLCVHLVTDNGTAFTSEEFQRFCKQNGIRHSTTPTYHPATNGAAENLENTVKTKIKVMMNDGRTMQEAVELFLFDYRTMEHPATNRSPAKLFLGRELRNRLSLLRPTPTIEKVNKYQEKQVKISREHAAN